MRRLQLLEDRPEHDVLCMSCDDEIVITDEVSPSSSLCLFVDVQFSPSSLFYVDACLGPQPPRYVLKSAADNLQRMEALVSAMSSQTITQF